jgi:precorrin-6A/cobalt-precorrin-6A reductase
VYSILNNHRIWLIGGTKESAELASKLSEYLFSVFITVTTENARSLYPIQDNLHLFVTNFTTLELESFINREKINLIIDASHPFAVKISQNAINIANKLQIPYLRFEREQLENRDKNIIYIDSFDELINNNYLQDQRVLLTIGYRNLPLFKEWQEKSRLYTRILPSAIALETALESGFTPDRIIALRPPIRAELEQALWQMWEISLVITKASGTAGGEDVKCQVAQRLGIPIIIINRPLINYSQKTNNIEEIVNFCYTNLYQ